MTIDTKTPGPWSQEVEIQHAAGGKKTRRFGAHLVGLLRADRLLDSVVEGSVRPAMAVFAASTSEASAFEANLRGGSSCVCVQNNWRGGKLVARYEFPPSAGYAWRRQSTEEGTIVTAYLPHLFAFDPGGVEDEGARFVAMPSQRWADAQRAIAGERSVGDAIEHCVRAGVLNLRWTDRAVLDVAEPRFLRALDALIPTAMLAVAMLDRRVRAPVIHDLRFQLQFFLGLHRATVCGRPIARSALTEFFYDESRLVGREDFTQRGLSWDDGKWQAGEERARGLGYEPAVAVRATHAQVEELLRQAVELYRETLRAESEARASREAAAAAAARDVRRPYAKRRVA